MNSKTQMFITIMAFYAVLTFIILPLGFYHFIEKKLSSAGNGFIVGSLLSIALWMGVGKNMVM